MTLEQGDEQRRENTKPKKVLSQKHRYRTLEDLFGRTMLGSYLNLPTLGLFRS